MRSLLGFLLVLVFSNGFATDVGEVAFPNSGSKEAQESFRRGLALLHNFEYEDAATAFQEAQKIDPGFAMAYWGEAMTHNHPIWMQQDRDAAKRVLTRLAPEPSGRFAKAPTQREKDYLNTLEILYGEGEKKDRDFAYSDAMAELHRKYPNDPDAAAFYALSLLGTAHEGRDESLYMRAAAVLEEVFREHPNHPGVVHYLIHCYDDPTHAPLGMRAARIYSKIAPSAAHAQHMTSHIFIAMGMWNEVVASNEVAVQVENKARIKRGKQETSCSHYNHWLMYGYLQQHRYEEAKKIVRGCYTEVSQKQEGYSVNWFELMRTRYLVDTQEWTNEVLSWNIGSGMDGEARFLSEYTNALAALHTGKLQDAKDAAGRMKTASVDYNKEARDDLERQRAEIMQQQLEALFLAQENKTGEAIELLRKLSTKEAGLPFSFGPPFVDKPSYEMLGELLLKTGHLKEAADAFRGALKRAPNRALSLNGLDRASQ